MQALRMLEHLKTASEYEGPREQEGGIDPAHEAAHERNLGRDHEGDRPADAYSQLVP